MAEQKETVVNDSFTETPRQYVERTYFEKLKSQAALAGIETVGSGLSSAMSYYYLNNPTILSNVVSASDFPIVLGVLFTISGILMTKTLSTLLGMSKDMIIAGLKNAFTKRSSLPALPGEEFRVEVSEDVIRQNLGLAQNEPIHDLAAAAPAEFLPPPVPPPVPPLPLVPPPAALEPVDVQPPTDSESDHPDPVSVDITRRLPRELIEAIQLQRKLKPVPSKPPSLVETAPPLPPLTITGFEPVIALASDFQNKLFTLMPLILSYEAPYPLTPQSLRDLPDTYTRIINNLSKNVGQWSSDFNHVNYSVRTYELLLKGFELPIDTLNEVNEWMCMNGPTADTFYCMTHLDEVDWNHYLGRHYEDTSKRKLPTLRFHNGQLEHVHFTKPVGPGVNMNLFRYEYATKPEVSSLYSVLHTFEVEPVSGSELVIDGNNVYRRLHMLHDNFVLALFLKADEYKQISVREARQHREAAAPPTAPPTPLTLAGGDKRKRLPVFYKTKTLVTMTAVMLASLTGYLSYMWSQESQFNPSNIQQDLGHVMNRVSANYNVELPPDVNVPGMFVTQFYGQARQHPNLEGLEIAALTNTQHSVLQLGGGKPENKTALQTIVSYVTDLWSPTRPTFNIELNFTTRPRIETAIESLRNISHVTHDMFNIEVLIQPLQDLLTRTNVQEPHFTDNDRRLVALQTQVYALERVLRDVYTDVQMVYTDMLSIVSKVDNYVTNATEEINTHLQELSTPNALITLDSTTSEATTGEAEATTPKAKLQKIVYNYRTLIQHAWYILYSVDTKLIHYPANIRDLLVQRIETSMTALNNLITDMGEFKEKNNLSEDSFPVKFIKNILFGQPKLYSSVKKITEQSVKLSKNVRNYVEQIRENYKFASGVIQEIETKSKELKQHYSKVEEQYKNTQMEVWGQGLKNMMTLIPNVNALTADLFQSVAPYSPPELIRDYKYKWDIKKQEIEEKLLFLTPAEKIIGPIEFALVQLGESMKSMADGMGVTLQSNDTKYQNLRLMTDTYRYFGSLVSFSGEGYKRSMRLLFLGDFGKWDIPLGVGSLVVEGANWQTGKLPHVSVNITVGDITLGVVDIPEYYLTGENATANYEFRVMGLHLVDRYTPDFRETVEKLF